MAYAKDLLTFHCENILALVVGGERTQGLRSFAALWAMCVGFDRREVAVLCALRDLLGKLA